MTTGYSASIPTGTEAGTYYVWYKAVGDENHSDSDPRHIEVRIEAPQPPASQPQTEAPQTQTEASAPAVQAERIIIPKTPAKVKAKAKKNSITVSQVAESKEESASG